MTIRFKKKNTQSYTRKIEKKVRIGSFGGKKGKGQQINVIISKMLKIFNLCICYPYIFSFLNNYVFFVYAKLVI